MLTILVNEVAVVTTIFLGAPTSSATRFARGIHPLPFVARITSQHVMKVGAPATSRFISWSIRSRRARAAAKSIAARTGLPFTTAAAAAAASTNG